MAIGYHLDDRQLELLLLASWFHDTGYDEGQEGHEILGCKYLTEFLKEENYTQSELDIMYACIMSTKMPQQPNTILEEIICDADMSHLGKKIYWDRCGRIRQELLLTKGTMMSDQEWIEFELSFMTNHSYHTDYAEDVYGKRKNKHIRQLVKQKLRLNPKKVESVEVLAKTKTEQKASKKNLR